ANELDAAPERTRRPAPERTRHRAKTNSTPAPNEPIGLRRLRRVGTAHLRIPFSDRILGMVGGAHPTKRMVGANELNLPPERTGPPARTTPTGGAGPAVMWPRGARGHANRSRHQPFGDRILRAIGPEE